MSSTVNRGTRDLNVGALSVAVPLVAGATRSSQPRNESRSALELISKLAVVFGSRGGDRSETEFCFRANTLKVVYLHTRK